LPILAIVILVLSGLGAVSVSSEEINRENISYSKISFQEKENYITIKLEGAESEFIKKDHYIVPTDIKTYTFPLGTKIIDVKCTPKNLHEQILTKELMVSPNPQCTSKLSLEKNDQVSQNPISIDKWFDYSVGCGLVGKERKIIVKVQTYPVQYHPETNYIQWSDEIDVKIIHEFSEQTTKKFNENYDFIILTPSEFSDELGSLVTHKNNRGVSTKLVTLNEIYGSDYFPSTGRDDCEKIKYFIKNAIENWNTRFVLLVGGDDEFPARQTNIVVDYDPDDPDNEVFVSDLYYADIYDSEIGFSSWDTNDNDVFGEYDWGSQHNFDELDLHPDVYVSRIACTSDSEVTTCVNKIKTYENNEAYTKDWFGELVVVGGDTSPNDEEEILEGEYVNQKIIEIMDGFVPTKCWASEGTLSTRTPLNAALNKGAGFVDFSGHGNPSLWATHPFNNHDIWIPVGEFRYSHVSNLINDDELPIVITGACSVAKYNERSNCFTWSFLPNPNGGGIASVGPAALSWGYDTSYVVKALGGKMQLELFKAYKQHGAFTFGEMWAKAISNYVIPNMDCGDYKTVEEWQPFGDPTLAIADESLPPARPDAPDGPSSGSTNKQYTYSASSTDPENDKLYYLFDWGNGEFSGWIGPYNSGQTAEASYAWSSQGDYQIKVKAKDEHGVQSEWSPTISISMPRSKTTERPLVHFLENYPRFVNLFRLIFSI